ncbi:hypothetical protein KI387_016571, partial [Taxus chinensis]
MVALGSQFSPAEEFVKGNTQHIKMVIKPSIPDNNTSWQVFDSDVQIIQFIQNEVEFSSSMQVDLHDSYGDQVIQLKSNNLPKGLVTLEKMFIPDDEFK